MTEARPLAEKIEQLRHLMGTSERDENFPEPSLLKEIPLFTSNETMPREGDEIRAKLGRSSR